MRFSITRCSQRRLYYINWNNIQQFIYLSTCGGIHGQLGKARARAATSKSYIGR